jgi:hypothetical protein
MTSGVSYSLSLLCSLLAILGGSRWSEAAKSPSQKKNVHPLTNMPGRASGIEVAYYLPEYADKKMPMGKQIIVLCHMKNGAKIPFNVTGIMGSLNSINEFNGFAGYAQNFTYKEIGFMLKPGEEATLSYDFKLSREHEPEKFKLAHTVFYESEKRGYSSTFFNEVRKCTLLYFLHLSSTLNCSKNPFISFVMHSWAPITHIPLLLYTVLFKILFFS